MSLEPTEVRFGLAPSYGLTTGHEVNEWFIEMLREYEEFEVETDKAGEAPLSFWSETVRGVMVGNKLQLDRGPSHRIISDVVVFSRPPQEGDIWLWSKEGPVRS